MKPSENLVRLGVELPTPAAPIGSYIPALRSVHHVFTSGQLPFRDGKLVYTGKVPADVPIPQAADGARIAMINALAAASQAAGGVDAIKRVTRVCVYVNSSPGFFEQPTVANGASDFLVEVFGDLGRHARSALGAAELPRNAVVEVELVVEV